MFHNFLLDLEKFLELKWNEKCFGNHMSYCEVTFIRILYARRRSQFFWFHSREISTKIKM